MSNCNNCFNGCTETISDQCIKYTGIDVPELGISTGDSLSVIEQALTTFLVSALNGTGIKINLDSIDVCTLVQQYLPTCGEMSIADISKALIQASCDIQEQVDAINAALNTLNADYTIECLTGVTASSDTHAIVQATITKLCNVSDEVDSLIEQLPLYVTKTELCELVTDCISEETSTALASSKMLPYSPIPYYGQISNYPGTGDSFDATGAGLGYWARVFMCNGQNGTPDIRGRAVIGSTNTPCIEPCDAFTLPDSTIGNPRYNQGDKRGNNTTTLALPQIPAHDHTGSTAITTIPPHTHDYNTRVTNNRAQFSNSEREVTTWQTSVGTTTSVTLTATTSLTIASQGQNEAHSNVQPGIAVYYIMYIPA